MLLIINLQNLVCYDEVCDNIVNPKIEKKKVGISDTMPHIVFAGIHCSDSTDCITVGVDPQGRMALLKSTDGGYTWGVILELGVYALVVIQAVAHPTKNHIYISAGISSIKSLVMLRSSDGGKTFDTTVMRKDEYAENRFFRSMHMADSLNGIGLNDGSVYITNDGWKSFRNVSAGWRFIGGGAPGKYCYAFDALNFLLYFARGRLGSEVSQGFACTTDGGKTWSEIPLGISDVVVAAIYFFPDKKTGWAVGGKATGVGNLKQGVFFKTTDGGFTWSDTLYEKKDFPYGSDLQDIVFLDSCVGYVVGAWGFVSRTYDGGKTWVRQAFPETLYNTPRNWVACAGRNILIGTFGYGLWLWREVGVSDVGEGSKNNGNSTYFYPNPFAEGVCIRFNEEIEGPIEIQIYDSMGNRVDSFRIDSPEQEVRFTPTDRAEGVYFYRIIGKNKTYTGNFVKIK